MFYLSDVKKIVSHLSEASNTDVWAGNPKFKVEDETIQNLEGKEAEGIPHCANYYVEREITFLDRFGDDLAMLQVGVNGTYSVDGFERKSACSPNEISEDLIDYDGFDLQYKIETGGHKIHVIESSGHSLAGGQPTFGSISAKDSILIDDTHFRLQQQTDGTYVFRFLGFRNDYKPSAKNPYPNDQALLAKRLFDGVKLQKNEQGWAYAGTHLDGHTLGGGILVKLLNSADQNMSSLICSVAEYVRLSCTYDT